MSSRPPVYVHLLPALIPPGALAGGIAVVIDVLRATTTMIHALAAGCDAIIPCGEVDEARRLASTFPVGRALLAGEREGLRIEGFDLGNSPSDCTDEACRGKTMVMTTTNGTRAIFASLGAERVLIAAFVNREATLDVLKSAGLPIHLVCAGTDGQVSLEDAMFAGSLAHEIDGWAWDELEAKALRDPGGGLEAFDESLLANDQAEIAASLWRETEASIEEGYTLADSLADGRGGRRVIAIGLGEDLEDAATLDGFSFAAELHRDPLRILPIGRAAGPRLRLIE